MEPLILAARSEWRSKLAEPHLNLEVQQLVGMLDESLLLNWDRELPQYMLLLTSNQLDRAGHPKALFRRSALWRRGGLGSLLVPLPRAEYQDWSKSISPFDRGNLDMSQERRQWASGVPMWSAIINRAFVGMNLSESHSCHVRDFSQGLDPTGHGRLMQHGAHSAPAEEGKNVLGTNPGLADPTLAQAVADLNSSCTKSLPRLGYAGYTWDTFIGAGVGKIVEANVRPGAWQLRVDGEHSG
jgi:hypothetical protein